MLKQNLFITGASWHHSQVALLKASHSSKLYKWVYDSFLALQTEHKLMMILVFCHRDNYGFVTYYNTKDAFTAIENGSRLRKSDELPFDLCFGGRRQFCKSSYADLGMQGFKLQT